MLTVSDVGGFALFLAAAFGLLFARDRVWPVTLSSQRLRQALLAIAVSFIGIAAIYGAFAVASIPDVDPGFLFGKKVRPYGKIVGGLGALWFAIVVWRWEREEK